MRLLLIAMLILTSSTSAFAQSERSPEFDMVLVAGMVRAGVERECEQGNGYGLMGAHPRFGKAIYAVAILEKWIGFAPTPCAFFTSAPAASTSSTLVSRPKSRFGLGAGFDVPVEEIHLTSRIAGGRLGNAAPWYSASLGFRYSRFFVQGEYGRERESSTTDGRSQTEWTTLAGVTFGVIL